jgi:hypothetical protein
VFQIWKAVLRFHGVWIIRQVGGAEEERGGVAALRRTSDDEGNAEMAEKPRFT